MTQSLAESLQKTFGLIPKGQETLPANTLHPTYGARSLWRLKMTRRLPESLQKQFGPFLKRQETLPTLGLCLRMRRSLSRVPEVCDALSSRSNACKWLAGLPRVCRKSLIRFQNARKLCPLWARACAVPYLGCTKFVMLYVRVLTLANDSQACRESADKIWADFETPGNFAQSGPMLAHVLPPT